MSKVISDYLWDAVIRNRMQELQRRYEMEQEKTFYVVWNPLHGVPTVKHASIEEAREEAKRLAIRNGVQEFFILQAVEGVVYRPEPVHIRTLRKP